MNDMTERIRGLISKSFDTTIPVNDISGQDDLFKIGMDSISAVKLIIEIETEFGFEFDDDDLIMDNVKSINRIAKFISARHYCV